VAEIAGAKHLVLIHLAPVDTPFSLWDKSQQGNSGCSSLGLNFMSFGVGSLKGSRKPREL